MTRFGISFSLRGKLAADREARHIEARHVNLAAESIVIPKEEAKGKKRPRIIHLHGLALEIIRRLLMHYPEGKLFRNQHGNLWKKSAICRRFDRLNLSIGMDALRAIGIPIPPLPRFDYRRFANKAELLAARKLHERLISDRCKQKNEGPKYQNVSAACAVQSPQFGYDPLFPANRLGLKPITGSRQD